METKFDFRHDANGYDYQVKIMRIVLSKEHVKKLGFYNILCALISAA